MKDLPPSNDVRLLWGNDMQHRDDYIKEQQYIATRKRLRTARQRLAKDPDYTQPYVGSKYADNKYAHRVNKDHPWRTPRENLG